MAASIVGSAAGASPARGRGAAALVVADRRVRQIPPLVRLLAS
ncbi:MAG: hypothetical protein ACRDT2_21125 [Natronosporangium sp.]